VESWAEAERGGCRGAIYESEPLRPGHAAALPEDRVERAATPPALRRSPA